MTKRPLLLPFSTALMLFTVTLTGAVCAQSITPTTVPPPLHLQWGLKALMPPATGREIQLGDVCIAALPDWYPCLSIDPYLRPTEALPYTVPAGYRLGITYAQMASKLSERASYLVLWQVGSVMSTSPQLQPPQPIWLEPGATLHVILINNDPQYQQVMTGLIQAVLVPIVSDYRTQLGGEGK